MRRSERDRVTGAIPVTVHETSASYAYRLTIANQDAEIVRLRRLLAEHGIKDPEGTGQ